MAALAASRALWVTYPGPSLTSGQPAFSNCVQVRSRVCCSSTTFHVDHILPTFIEVCASNKNNTMSDNSEDWEQGSPIAAAQQARSRASFQCQQWGEVLYTADGRPVPAGAFMVREASYTPPDYYVNQGACGSAYDVPPPRQYRGNLDQMSQGHCSHQHPPSPPAEPRGRPRQWQARPTPYRCGSHPPSQGERLVVPYFKKFNY